MNHSLLPHVQNQTSWGSWCDPAKLASAKDLVGYRTQSCLKHIVQWEPLRTGTPNCSGHSLCSYHVTTCSDDTQAPTPWLCCPGNPPVLGLWRQRGCPAEILLGLTNQKGNAFGWSKCWRWMLSACRGINTLFPIMSSPVVMCSTPVPCSSSWRPSYSKHWSSKLKDIFFPLWFLTSSFHFISLLPCSY